MSHANWGFAVWGLWLLLFLALELPAVFHLTPWPTLSRTVWNLRDRTSGGTSLLVIGGLAALAFHLVAQGRRERKR